ncbi:MAG: DUF6270 domain-containing protein [Roseburia sp.]|nr:DUF6270 domain-containing protein [Roseburia sp.]
MEKITIRLNGSSYINDMELKERFRVLNDSLWISVLSLAGNPQGETFTPEGEVSPYLTMDLEKRLAQSLEEEPADFLVVDMCYSAGHALCKWRDQVFTKNPKFIESDFRAEHEEELEEIDVMRDREFDWKPYMDSYLELIGKYFDRNHIILVKSRCPAWYVTHTHVRKMRKKARRAYNKRIKELEDYFVEKMDPYIIDIYSHYYVDFNHKKGFTMSSYEKPFYHHAKRLISMIVRTLPEQRVFREQEYYIRLGRFIKYYDNLFAKNNVGLFMDDSKFLDHLVLQLGRPVLTEYESDFVAIEKKGYQSIDEILEKYDFKFAASLQECLKTVKAVEEGDLFRDGVNYDTIFEYDMKIIGRFTELVKEELDKTGLFEEELHITTFHCRDYYLILSAYKKVLSEKYLKKHILSLDKKAEGRNKRKLLIKTMKKKYSDPMKALANAVNEYYKPVLVDLWGSCITREILNEDDGHFQINSYAYRNCFLFAFDEPIPYEDKNFEDLSLFENSTWRVGYIKSAFHKDLPERLKKTKSQWLLLDFYDLVCDVVEYHGGVLTADNEVRALKFFKQIKNECNITSIDEILDDEEIRRRFDVFIRFVKERYGKNVIFIRADVKTKFLDYKRELRPLRGYKKETLLKKKKFLNKWQDYFEKQMECHVIDYARKYQADDLCVSGAFMVHYEKEFYEKGYRELRRIIGGK